MGGGTGDFLSLIIISSIADFFIGLNIYSNSNNITRKIYLYVSILLNLTLLGFF